MVKGHSKKRIPKKIPIKSWKVWFYTLWLPLIIWGFVLFSLYLWLALDSSGCSCSPEVFCTCIPGLRRVILKNLLIITPVLLILFCIFYYVIYLLCKNLKSISFKKRKKDG